MNNVQKERVNEWVGQAGQRWTLCYRKTTHGGNAGTFHQRCDGRGPSVTVASLSTGRLIGGYASENWHNNGSNITAASSFLFSLTNNFRHELFRNSDNAMYGANAHGPTFGGNHDWYVNSSLNGGYCNPGNVYRCRVGSGAQCYDDFCGNYNSWTINDLEVWVRN